MSDNTPDKQYYTPAIEDLFVGYECEITWNNKEWVGFCIRDGWFGRDGEGDFPDAIYALNTTPPTIKTPFFSKEGIEKEGWEYINYPSAEGPSFKKDIFNCQLLAKGNINSSNAGVTKDATITFWTTSGDVIFLGECPSINEFRKITKLLNI